MPAEAEISFGGTTSVCATPLLATGTLSGNVDMVIGQCGVGVGAGEGSLTFPGVITANFTVGIVFVGAVIVLAAGPPVPPPVVTPALVGAGVFVLDPLVLPQPTVDCALNGGLSAAATGTFTFGAAGI